MIAEYPVLVFLVAAVLVWVVPRRVGTVVMFAAPAVAMAQLIALDVGTVASAGYFGYELQYLRFDSLAAPFAYVFVAASFLAAVFGTRTMSTLERVAALFSAGLGLGVVLAGDLLTLFVMWEAKAVASAILIAAATGAQARTAAFRYLIVHVVGGSLLLGGIIWHLFTDGSLEFSLFESSVASYAILFAFLLSAAAPPLNAWLPDAYPQASVAGTVVLSIFTTKAAVYALLRGFAGYEVLIALGVAMALFGVVYAMLENDVRRLLSYHIISQVGFMVTGVGIGTAAAINGTTAHAFAHILYKGLLLMGMGAVVYATGRNKLTELGGLARAMPAVMVLYMIGAVSISGVPLFSGFISKELVVDSARSESLGPVVQLLKLASVGTFLSVGLKLPWFTFGGQRRDVPLRPVPPTMLVAMGLAAAANVLLGLWPSLLYGILPFPVDYQPYTAPKLLEVVQLLSMTGLVFALLVGRLTAKPKISLDTDWVYRGAPLELSMASQPARGRLAEVGAVARRTATRPVTALRAEIAGLGDRTSPVVPTTVFGVVAMAVFLVVLVTGLVAR